MQSCMNCLHFNDCKGQVEYRQSLLKGEVICADYCGDKSQHMNPLIVHCFETEKKSFPKDN